MRGLALEWRAQASTASGTAGRGSARFAPGVLMTDNYGSASRQRLSSAS